MRVSWNNVLEAQKDIKGHLHTLNKVFQTGSNWHQKARDRTRAAKEVANLTIPLLYLLLKDHKPEEKDGLKVLYEELKKKSRQMQRSIQKND